MKIVKQLMLAVALTLATVVAFAQSVNINTADATELALALNGVGEVKAQAIVEYREENGRFETAEDLLNVKGIGEKTLDKNLDNIDLGTKTSKAERKRKDKTS